MIRKFIILSLGENIADFMESAVLGDNNNCIAGENAVVTARNDDFSVAVDAGNEEILL